MKIKANRILFDDGEECSYKVVSIEKCCDEIIGDVPIELNKEYSYENDNCDYSVKLIKTELNYEYDDSPDFEDFYHNINYCPFCGEKIEINIVEEINMSEKYGELCNERNAVNIERRNVDSKKKEAELNGIIRKLDKEINEFWKSDGLESVGND